MSRSETTNTKTLSDTVNSESTDNSLFQIADRWTNNITYRQLVISSCVGIFQVWWHPYLHDFKKLLPFLCLFNVFSIFIGYPLFYLELALGVVTKKGVLNCWDMAPIARGVGFAMLTICVFSALAIGAVGAWCLAFFVHSFHSFLPWLHCAASAQPACAARHRPLPTGTETPAHSFFFNFVLNLKRDGLDGGLGNIVWELAVYYIFCWTLIYLIAVKRIYSYSKLVLFKDVLTYFVLVCCAIGATRLNGADRMFKECDWSVLLQELEIWHRAIEYSFIQMTISQGSLIMLGAYCPAKQHKLGTTTLLSFLASKTSTTTSALVLGAAHGALHRDYDNVTDVWSGPSASMILWSDYVARIPGSQFWSALLFFTMFVLALSTAALLVQTIMSTFTGRSIRKINWAFLIIICCLFCFIGVITVCTQGGLYIVNFLMNWPVGKPRMAIGTAIAAVVTYVYGQTTFCEDVYFAVGEYPSMFMRICWAFIPGFLMGTFAFALSECPAGEKLAGCLVVTFIVFPLIIVLLFYFIFKCRIRNIVVRNE
ncbi:hypothetical protein K1T71_005974 [Dendrolimus kikuchii]|uniref:Uncharacterized protein n=1 Tax=Dendrolimus kikuchii TaxID=765133 RepID=A0ACC1D2T1_9NEOP|nr:hypothetical protein K1T71_005974 [Dendrolimus kikuchii]